MNQIGLCGEYKLYALEKGCLRGLIWPWHLTYKLHARSLHTLWLGLCTVREKLRFYEGRINSWQTVQPLINRYESIKRNDTCLTLFRAIYFSWNRVNIPQQSSSWRKKNIPSWQSVYIIIGQLVLVSKLDNIVTSYR